MRAQLHQHARTDRAHQPVRERDVAGPGALGPGARRAPEQRIEFRVEQRGEARSGEVGVDVHHALPLMPRAATASGGAADRDAAAHASRR